MKDLDYRTIPLSEWGNSWGHTEVPHHDALTDKIETHAARFE
jgi:hypothetical protein